MSRQLDRCSLIERSLNKRFRKELWTPFMKSIRDYGLLSANDRIAVCVSGGSASLLLAKLMQELQRHSEVPFECAFLILEPENNTAALQTARENAALLRLPLQFIHHPSPLQSEQVPADPLEILAGEAKRLGCSKLALGHHFNDVIETVSANLFFNARLAALPPREKCAALPEMEIIRPLYGVHEEDIHAWCRYNELSCPACSVSFLPPQEAEAFADERRQVRAMIQGLKETHPDIELCIFNSIHRVSLDTLVGWEAQGEHHTFLDHYDS